MLHTDRDTLNRGVRVLYRYVVKREHAMKRLDEYLDLRNSQSRTLLRKAGNSLSYMPVAVWRNQHSLQRRSDSKSWQSKRLILRLCQHSSSQQGEAYPSMRMTAHWAFMCRWEVALTTMKLKLVVPWLGSK